MISTLVVFGASGDLTGRLLLPAVAALRGQGVLGADFRLIGAAQQDWSVDEFADHVRHRLAEHAPSVRSEVVAELLCSVAYRRADVTDPGDVAAVLDHAVTRPAPVAVYLALPSQLMLDAVRAVRGFGLPAGSRIAVEKPFGHDLTSAVELNRALAELDGSARQSAVYRVDHALAMTGVQRLVDARLPDGGAAIDWSSHDIDQLELLWEETLALEGRASFFDRAGALRDVLQNHLLQVMCTVAQSHPDGEHAADPSARRASVLRAVRPLSLTDVGTRTRRARYSAGRLAGTDSDGGRDVPDYVAEDGVEPTRNTETFAEVILDLDLQRWAGTKFVLRAGKALDGRRRGVRVQLRAADPPRGSAHAWFDFDDADADAGAPGGAEAAAYQRIVADVLAGSSIYAVGADEAELAWRVVTPVLRGWAAGTPALATYAAGSTGPRDDRPGGADAR